LNTFYIGSTSNPDKRLIYHNCQNKGWTRRGRPWKLVFQKDFESKRLATSWERWIKKQKKRPIIDKIISGTLNWK